MKNIIIAVCFLLVAAFGSASAQLFNEEAPAAQDSLINYPAEIKIIPNRITLTKSDTSKFVSVRVKVLNKGGQPLEIERVTGSCKCSTATVLNGIVYPMQVGEIILNINTDGMKNSNIVEYTVFSNAKTPKVDIEVTVEGVGPETGTQCK